MEAIISLVALHAFETWQRPANKRCQGMIRSSSAKKRGTRFAPNDTMSPTLKLEKGAKRGKR
jgi:hypothetical protein